MAQGMSPEEAFAVLGNETRMEILQAVWRQTREGGYERPDPVSFTELRDAVGESNSANFNYHLDQLVGQFIDRVEGGYLIRQAGTNVVRAILAGIVTEDPSFGPTEVDAACYRCEKPVAIYYDDERLYTHCQNCAGAIAFGEKSGTISMLTLPPAGLRNRTRADAMRVAYIRYFLGLDGLCAGVCPVCAGESAIDIQVCSDHAVPEGELCPTCHREPEVIGEAICETCSFYRVFVPAFVLLRRPGLSSTLEKLGLNTTYPGYQEFAAALSWPVDASENPFRARYTLPSVDGVVVIGPDLSVHRET